MNREQRRAQAKSLKKTKEKFVRMMEIPVIVDKDPTKVCGILAFDMDLVPQGVDWGLIPGLDANGQITQFSTTSLNRHNVNVPAQAQMELDLGGRGALAKTNKRTIQKGQ